MKRLRFRSSFPRLVLALTMLSISTAGFAAKQTKQAETGQSLAMKLCQACHFFPGADQAGTLGPPFAGMTQRFPERQRLQAIIYDAQESLKPHTMMPPFGRHGFLDKKQTEKLIDFLYTL